MKLNRNSGGRRRSNQFKPGNKSVVVLGILDQPLQESYCTYESWITTSWLKPLWETCDKFDVVVEFINIPLKLLREGN